MLVCAPGARILNRFLSEKIPSERRRFVRARFYLAVFLSSCAMLGCAHDAGLEYDRMKSLSGDWVGSEPDGTPVRASYQVISAGTVVMETLHIGTMPVMFTMYYLDGGKLMLTHYCSVGNQPRMSAMPANGQTKEITFKFLDATNLSSRMTPHNHGLVVSFEDSNNFTEKWTWRENGHDGYWIFHLKRVS